MSFPCSPALGSRLISTEADLKSAAGEAEEDTSSASALEERRNTCCRRSLAELVQRVHKLARAGGHAGKPLNPAEFT